MEEFIKELQELMKKYEIDAIYSYKDTPKFYIHSQDNICKIEYLTDDKIYNYEKVS